MENVLIKSVVEEQKNIRANTDVRVYSCTLEDLFTDQVKGLSGKLSIPEYQRPYVWQQKQINQILGGWREHLNKQEDDKPMYYLGSVILHQNDQKLNIIDGQQRLTTALILRKIIAPHKKSGINYTSGISIRNIKANYQYLKQLNDEESLIHLDFTKINITLVVTNTEDLAYTFFETQNTGGVRLKGSHIIKAHHLRAIQDNRIVNFQARKWEAISSNKVESITALLTKARYWDSKLWRDFPSFRNKRELKQSLIEEFTLLTHNDDENLSYHYSVIKNEGDKKYQLQESDYKQIRQPLSDGNNTLDYITEYIDLYQILFEQNDHRASQEFYELREALIDKNYGSVFLKEFYQIVLMCYVSRFGFYKLFEASLWLFRAIYSMRLTMNRNVVEKSIFKYARETMIINHIVESYTPQQLFNHLTKYKYELNPNNMEENYAKGRHINCIKAYFGKNTINTISYYTTNLNQFDKDLLTGIHSKIKTNYA
uniref:DUF262 domain-containing protein n=1 Tax=uncultured Tenacibaculum sp. TaxID=174713 RepID=UPI0026274F69|nr:DUF262 domain-containing protein [uncultured Tenacibaculum sp.]